MVDAYARDYEDTYEPDAGTIPGGTHVHLDTSSEAYGRLTRAGFTIDEWSLHAWGFSSFGFMPAAEVFRWQEYQVTCNFTCVCGKRETIVCQIEGAEVYEPIDIAQKIEDFGGIDEEHLRSDGYSEEQIKHIRKEYD